MSISNQSVDKLQDQFETAYPQDILKWAAETFAEQLVVVTSFQPTGIVTLHMLQEIAPDTPVITLDTGLLFPETYQLIDNVEKLFNLNLRRVTPELTLEQQAAQHGDKLWEHAPNNCCHMRKVLPLQNALQDYEAWITGIRRDQSARRSQTPAVAWDAKNNLFKLCPFINWTEQMIWTYIEAYNLPYNPLHDAGYPSIGCSTCTKAVSNPADMRSGRWGNHSKTECGIHTELVQPS